MKKSVYDESISKCYGCGSCELVCPYNCIDFIVAQDGFHYPRINDDCVDCGLCKQVCPAFSQNLKEIFNDEPKFVCGCWDNNVEGRISSSSGGVFALLSNFIIRRYEGVVYGAMLDEKFNVFHKRICQIDEIKGLQGSKYVQSNTLKVFQKVKNDLENGVQVLYSGTPCMIAGLKLFLKKKYANLKTADLICHGVPSPKIFKEYIEFLKRKHGEVSDFKFRYKKKVGYSSYLSFKSKNKRITELIGISPYMFGYYKGYYNRECCYSCAFTKVKRVADITMGDFWGFGKIYPKIKKSEKYGVSCVLLNTIKGIKMFDEIKDSMTIIESTLEKCLLNQPSLRKPNKRPIYRNVFFYDLSKKKIHRLFAKDLKPRFYLLKKYLPDEIRILVRKLNK